MKKVLRPKDALFDELSKHIDANEKEILDNYIRERENNSLTATPMPEPLPNWDTLNWRLTNTRGHFPLEIINAARSDAIFNTAYPIERKSSDNIIDLEGHFLLETGSGGSGGNQYLSDLVYGILETTIFLHQFYGTDSKSDIKDILFKQLGIVRSILSGNKNEIPYLTYFHGTGIPANIKRDCMFGKIWGINQNTWHGVWDNREAFDDKQAHKTGFILEEKVPIKATIGKAESIKKMMSEEPSDTIKRSGSHNLQIALAVAIDDKDRTLSCRTMSSITISPFNRYNRTLVERTTTGTYPCFIEATELDDALKFLKSTEKVTGTTIGIAESRLVNSLNERTNDTDRLIDVSIGLENIFGAQNYSSKAIAIGLSRLLGTDREEREKIHKEAKTLYDMRSKIVHGSSKLKNNTSISEQTKIATNYLRKSIRKLYEPENLHLLNMNSNERFKEIALR